MKKQFIKVLSLCAILAASATLTTSCNDDDEDDNYHFTKETVTKKVYILNEGSNKKNNSTLDAYNNTTNTLDAKVFTESNGEGLGDTGQDIIVYGDRIYVSVNESNYFAKLDLNGKVIEKYSFNGDQKMPRFLEASNGYVYVSLWSGHVAKFDTTSISNPKYVQLSGLHAEEMSINNGNLYVTIAGDYNVAYDNKVDVISLASFEKVKTIEVAEDPTNIIAFDDNLYVIHYNTTTWAQDLISVDLATGKYELLYNNVAKMATNGKSLFYVESSTDWTTYQTNTAFYRKGADGTGVEFLDLTGNEQLKNATVYLFDIDPVNGDFYIGTTDYATNGVIYRFDKNGKFIAQFETSGLNPNHAAFYCPTVEIPIEG